MFLTRINIWTVDPSESYQCTIDDASDNTDKDHIPLEW